jgi:hypothetical protein
MPVWMLAQCVADAGPIERTTTASHVIIVPL